MRVVVEQGWGHLLHSIDLIRVGEWSAHRVHGSRDDNHVVGGGSQDGGSSKLYLSLWISQRGQHDDVIGIVTKPLGVKTSRGSFKEASVSFKLRLPRLSHESIVGGVKDHPKVVDSLSVWIITNQVDNVVLQKKDWM